MWLSDFEEAIAAMKKHCNYSCFSVIQVNDFGDRFIFQPHDIKDFYFVYMRQSKKIYKCYSDTWRNPDHYEVIYGGDNYEVY